MKQCKILATEVLDWELNGKTLRQALTAYAVNEMNLEMEEGEFTIGVDACGQFVMTFVPTPKDNMKTDKLITVGSEHKADKLVGHLRRHGPGRMSSYKYSPNAGRTEFTVYYEAEQALIPEQHDDVVNMAFAFSAGYDAFNE